MRQTKALRCFIEVLCNRQEERKRLAVRVLHDRCYDHSGLLWALPWFCYGLFCDFKAVAFAIVAFAAGFGKLFGLP